MTQPINKNFLHNVKWQFTINRLPSTSFFIQNINIPSISFGRRDVPTPFVRLPIIGDHLEYGDLNITFKVSEDMSSYLEIFNWMVGLGFPDSFDQHRELVTKPLGQDREYSDGTLLLLTNAKNVSFKVEFKKLFPVFLSDLVFDTSGQANEIDVTASFAYEKFTITRV